LAAVKRRKPKIIQDKKRRGEWAESMFLVRAGEEGLPASKPWGDSSSYDCVVGRPGKFVAVQVKCTIAKLQSGEGYNCCVCSCHKPYPPGSFDFLAAYVIREDAWYIIPEKEIRGLKSISLCTTGLGAEAKYEPYREARSLLRKASEIGDSQNCVEQASTAGSGVAPPSSAVGRMEVAAKFFMRSLERGNVIPGKSGGES
jgi:PD-(D/E)XK endonuclease